MGIQKLSETLTFPIGKHLNINFYQLTEKDNYVQCIFNDLKKSGFDKVLSRVLVFVRSRKNAEDYAVEFNQYPPNQKELNWSANYFHAGIEAEDRQRIYDDYKNGITQVLFATKAFGMGMNIPNIHYLYHIRPSSNFEDFLQEVGRAGRKKSDYEKAGFNESRLIQTVCYYKKEDFRKIRDLMKSNQTTWKDVEAVQKVVNDYYYQFHKAKGQAIALPKGLLEKSREYREHQSSGQVLVNALYWLEKLRRIKLTYYVPSHLVFNTAIYTKKFDLSKIADESSKKLVKAILDKKRNKTGESIEIKINTLKKAIGTKTFIEVYKTIIQAQKKEYVQWKLEKYVRLTKTQFKQDEFLICKKYQPILAIKNLAKELLQGVRGKHRKVYSLKEVERIAQNIVPQYINTSNYAWYQTKLKNIKDVQKKFNQKINNQVEDFTTKRVKHVSWLINKIPKIKHQIIIDIETGEKQFIIEIDNTKSNNWNGWLDFFINDVHRIARYLKYKAEEFKRGELIQVVDVINNSGIRKPTLAYFTTLMTFLKKMNYIFYSGGFVPISIQMKLVSNAIIDVKQNADDLQTQKEFEEQVQLKELRLASLEVFSKISSRKEQHQFITDYFNTSGKAGFLILLDQYILDPNSPILKGLREEALNDAYDNLNPKQKEMYDAPLDQNLSVIAGPGSGKTHTLVLRIARLIHKEDIDPSKILVLAFNRAVVLELKERVKRIFQQLGYSRRTKSLKVFTFHGLVRYILKQEVDTSKLSEWTDALIQKIDTEPQIVNTRLGLIKYIFIDEFQDINQKRLSLIQKLVNPNFTNLTTIGDPNQSIYGFDRIVDELPTIGPLSYYEDFDKIFTPKYLYLNTNYRSYQEIIDTSSRVLKHLTTPFDLQLIEIPALNAKKGNLASSVENYNSSNHSWTEKLSELFEEKYQEIAIMVRTNEEIYRAYHKLKEMEIPADFEVRIQGDAIAVFKSREFQPFVTRLSKRQNEPLPSDFLTTFIKNKEWLLTNNPNWYEFYLNVLHALYFEFDKSKDEGATHEDLYNFIENFSKKDDGQLYQLYERNKNILEFPNKKRIILTTIHRVKGLEYEAVMVLPSYAELPFKPKEHIESSEYYDEEIRLYYVAYSRAKEKLIIFHGKRERAIYRQVPFDNIELTALQYPIKSGIDKIIFFTLAKKSIQKKLQHIKLGTPISLHRNNNGNWSMKAGHKIIGYLSSGNLKKRRELQLHNTPQRLSGLYISSFTVHTYEEARQYDEEKGTSFTKKWDDFCRKKGFIIIPDFAGYGL